MLKLKTRNSKNITRKVLVYGLPGHGKSTFASNYCKKNNLKPVVLDIDDTNFTGDSLAEIDLNNDLKTYNSVIETIKDVKNSDDYDTVVIDGLGSLLELLTSKAKGQKKFLDRSERFNNIFNDLVKSGLNLIFIGQNDCNLESYTDSLPNKSIIKVNSIVNETYYCLKDEKGFSQNIDKFRKELENKTENKPSLGFAKSMNGGMK